MPLSVSGSGLLTTLDGPINFDKLLSMETGVGAVAERNVPATSAVFATHFPRFPVVPGVLLLQDLSHLGSIMLTGSATAHRLTSISRTRFRHYVRPGDVARLSVSALTGDSTKEGDSEQIACSGLIEVDGNTVMTVRRMEFCAVESANSGSSRG